MKLLVFSDSHGNTVDMVQIVGRERPDGVFHLGDVARDIRVLSETYPALPLWQVCGNCDGRSDLPEERVVELEGKRILMMHGHTRAVKCGMGAAVAAARQAGAGVLLFGHTHVPLCQLESGLWILNPGSVRGFPAGTYGIVVLERGEIFCYTCAI